MQYTTHIAKHFRDVYFGGNWTCSNLKDQLQDVDWQMATKQVHTFNTIVTLVYHTNYYIDTVSKVLTGGPLEGKDEDSFQHPPLTSEEEWQKLLNETWTKAERFAEQIEQLPDSLLDENFTAEKYGNYFRHLHGIIEHMHYHLGQIALIKKWVQAGN